MLQINKQEQEAAMLRDIRLANNDEVHEYVEETNKNFAVTISRP